MCGVEVPEGGGVFGGYQERELVAGMQLGAAGNLQCPVVVA